MPKSSCLPSQSGLLVVGPVERVEVGEELLRVRLHHVPGRVADQGVEPAPLGREHVGELEFPVEELESDAKWPMIARVLGRLGGTSAAWGRDRSDSSSVGQNQTAHHSSIACLSRCRAGLPRTCSR